MNKITIVGLDKDKVYKLICDNLYGCKTKLIEVEDAKYHHNIPYVKTASAIKHGLLSIEEEYRLRGEALTPELKWRFSREGGHINGITEISLASMDIDFSRVYPDEDIYYPDSPFSVDILISGGGIKAYRITEHYANEFLTEKKVSNEHFKAIDIRLLKYIRNHINEENLSKAIDNYNYLIEIADTMIKENLNIPLREMSYENITLDKQKVAELPKIKLKV